VIAQTLSQALGWRAVASKLKNQQFSGHPLYQLRHCGLAPLQSLGDTLFSWSQEIARMWRFTRNNAITEGFHTKMEVLQRQAYGFRNFNNYRLRVRVLCS
jgi:transposase